MTRLLVSLSEIQKIPRTDVVTLFAGPYRFLSNFWVVETPVTLHDDDTLSYDTVENAYQASKTLDLEKRKRFSNQRRMSPSKAKAEGRKLEIREDWEEIKIPVMYDLLLQKFNPVKNPILARGLQKTGNSILIEGNGWGDRFWGVHMGEGENWLGRLLMEIRAYYWLGDTADDLLNEQPSGTLT